MEDKAARGDKSDTPRTKQRYKRKVESFMATYFEELLSEMKINESMVKKRTTGLKARD